MILFYFIYHYGWTHERYFTTPVGVWAYYVVPAVSAGLLFASLQLQSSLRIKLALVLLSTGFSLCGAELFLQILDSRVLKLELPLHWLTFPSYGTVEAVSERLKGAKKFGVDFDTRSKLEVIADLRRKGIDAYPGIPPRWLLDKSADGSLKSALIINSAEVLPLGGISNKVTVFCNENGDYTIYESDEHGFHNPTGIWGTGRIDIAALGDSFTQGACVQSDGNFVALIRKRYPGTVTLGGDDNGPLLMLAGIKEYVEYVKPKVVLWFYYEGNDLVDLMQEKNSRLLLRYIGSDFKQGLFGQQSAIDRALTEYVDGQEKQLLARRNTQKTLKSATAVLDLSTVHIDSVIRLGHLRRRLGLVYGTSQHEKEHQSTTSKVEMELFAKVLSRAKESVGVWGGSLYFVYLPQWQRYARPEVGDKHHDRVLTLAKTLGLPVIDIHRAFLAHGDPLALFPFRQHGHYNMEGHRLVAEEVLRSISFGQPNSFSSR